MIDGGGGQHVGKINFSLLRGAGLLIIFLMVLYIPTETLRHPYVGVTLGWQEDSWVVRQTDPYGKAWKHLVRPGDRLISADGQDWPHPRDGQTEASLTGINTAAFQRGDGSILTISIKADRLDWVYSICSVAAAILLMAAGEFAHHRNSGSPLIRRYYLLNLLMTLILLTVFSTELTISDLVLSTASFWFPYALLSFCLSFVLRAVPVMWAKVFRFLRIIGLGFTCYIAVAVTRDFIPAWIRETLHGTVIVTLALILAMIGGYWQRLEHSERVHARVLAAALSLSLLPYLAMYAIPDLLHQSFLLAPELALLGLLPLSAAFLYILDKRTMVGTELYLPRLLLHVLYYAGMLLLLFWASAVRNPAQNVGLFVCFTVVTPLYRRKLRQLDESAPDRHSWKKRQKQKLSLRLAEADMVRDILHAAQEFLEAGMHAAGVCLIWHDGVQLHVQGTGLYSNPLPEEPVRWMEHSFWEKRLEAVRVYPIGNHGNFSLKGYICMGPKRNGSDYSEEELERVEAWANLVSRLLINAASLTAVSKASKSEPAVSRSQKGLMMQAQQTERMRLSYYLHDRLLQNLIFLSRDLEELAEGKQATPRQIGTWLKCLYDSQQDIRSLSDELYPHIVDKAGLEEALRWLLRTAAGQSGFETVLHYRWMAEPPSGLLKAALFRMLRELVRNVQKHAAASRVEMEVSAAAAEIRCTVKDDGTGFDTGDYRNRQSSGEGVHLGLISINQQLDEWGGTMEIQSATGEGTVITLRLPVSADEEGRKNT